MNAIKYTPDGGQVLITGSPLPDSEGRSAQPGVQIAVADTGIGIDPGHQARIFDKFYQTGEVGLHSSSTVKFQGGGPGLGLAIVKGIVEAHHGRVWVESSGCDTEACPGSCFYVVLPEKQPSMMTLLPQNTADAPSSG
jgi:signal transduction histidine kinase